MKTLKLAVGMIAVALVAVLLMSPAFAQQTAPAASPAAGQMNDKAMMDKMMELSKLNENHKLLSSMDGKWNYTVKMWMNGDEKSKPDVSTGTAVRKSIMDGRYVVMDVSGKMDMPGPDGKIQSMMFKGHGIEGYD